MDEQERVRQRAHELAQRASRLHDAVCARAERLPLARSGWRDAFAPAAAALRAQNSALLRSVQEMQAQLPRSVVASSASDAAGGGPAGAAVAAASGGHMTEERVALLESVHQAYTAELEVAAQRLAAGPAYLGDGGPLSFRASPPPPYLRCLTPTARRVLVYFRHLNNSRADCAAAASGAGGASQ